MAKIKDLARIVAKWRANAGAAGESYREGVSAPGVDWEGPARLAESAYGQGVQAAIARGAFGRGISQAGNAKWQRGATTKGVERYPGGVAAAEGDFREGFSPYHSVIAGVSLPPKGPKGAEGNYERVKAVGRALHQAKLGRG